jgi:hypothetical protein
MPKSSPQDIVNYITQTAKIQRAAKSAADKRAASTKAAKNTLGKGAKDAKKK